MKAYRCDRCKRYFDNMPDGWLTVWEEEKKLDICPKCYRQLDSWVRMEKRPKLTEIEVPEINGGFIFK